MKSPQRLTAIIEREDDGYVVRNLNPKKPGGATTLRVTMLIDARALKLASAEGGNQRLVLDVLGGIWGEGDQAIGTVNNKFTIEATAEKMQQDLEKQLAIELDVPVPRAGGYQLRCAVREALSGLVGSATSFIEIPDLSGKTLAMSSVLLTAPDGNAVTRAIHSGRGYQV